MTTFDSHNNSLHNLLILKNSKLNQVRMFYCLWESMPSWKSVISFSASLTLDNSTSAVKNTRIQYYMIMEFAESLQHAIKVLSTVCSLYDNKTDFISLRGTYIQRSTLLLRCCRDSSTHRSIKIWCVVYDTIGEWTNQTWHRFSSYFRFREKTMG